MMDRHGFWVGTEFEPPSADSRPDIVFPCRKVNATKDRTRQRFCLRWRYNDHREENKTMMIYTDGSCLGNGRRSAKGVFGLVFNDTENGVFQAALEKRGPDGMLHVAASNRAELRAVIAALEYRAWWGGGWERVVIVTDSTYVHHGATSWIRQWSRNGRVKVQGQPVANQDLWKRLSDVMGSYAAGGCEISFWAVRRELNSEADSAAKAGGLMPLQDWYLHFKCAQWV
jgi:ribonuclease HI